MKNKSKVRNGPGVKEMRFPLWPQLAVEILNYVPESLKSGNGNYGGGEKEMDLEIKWAEWNGVRFAVSCTNGTAAPLQQEGKDAWLPPAHARNIRRDKILRKEFKWKTDFMQLWELQPMRMADF